MFKDKILPRGLACILFLSLVKNTCGQATSNGIFSRSVDVGRPAMSGSTRFDPGNATYTISGGGKDIWSTNDEFHFVWKQVSGDVSLSASIRFISASGMHSEVRKAGLLIRQSLDADSPCVEAVIHGNGMAALQCRENKGDYTSQFETHFGKPSAPIHLQIEKRGEFVTMSIADGPGPWRPTGGFYRIKFKEPFYIGLGVCAHDDRKMGKTETAEFTQVEIGARPGQAHIGLSESGRAIEFIPVQGSPTAAYFATNPIGAINLSRNGRFLIFNEGGRLYRMPTNGEPELLDTGILDRIDDCHGFSPDGTKVAFSDESLADGARIYIIPVAGGKPLLVTSNAPSYFHGWSRDGKTIAFTGVRSNNFDIYTVPSVGGDEIRLTTDPGKDDAPDFSADGGKIYFNSNRTGRMQIWRMNADGSNQEQVTMDEHCNIFPHPSPDGRFIVFLSYAADAKDYPLETDLMVRTIPVAGGPPHLLAKLFGGADSLGASCWSPFSRFVAVTAHQPW
jgi:TolB protein